MDDILIEVLQDGRIRIETNPISAPNHANADQLVKLIERLAGGPATHQKRPDAHLRHTHAHHHHHKH